MTNLLIKLFGGTKVEVIKRGSSYHVRTITTIFGKEIDVTVQAAKDLAVAE